MARESLPPFGLILECPSPRRVADQGLRVSSTQRRGFPVPSPRPFYSPHTKRREYGGCIERRIGQDSEKSKEGKDIEEKINV